MSAAVLRLDLTTDPSAFLAAAGELLAADPVRTTLVATVTARAIAEDERGVLPGPHPRWWLSVRDAADQVVGIAMRTAPFAPHPAYLLPMPDEAAVALARLLHERGEPLGGVNGALVPARVLAEETARLSGGTTTVQERTRLWELGELVAHDAPGGLRIATAADVPLATAWWNDFGVLAAEMTGRVGPPHGSESLSEDELASRVEAGLVWLWEDPDGEVVHLTHHNVPAYGVVRIGPVITPREHRRRGYAGAAVAQVSARLRAEGHRVCLFTDQDNPTSNRIYAAIGFRPVVDTASLVIR
ncbi:GNAT family N-acetyltransferase [Nocardioides sp. W7]|uniref:GNAT family N-acetyltransferase n=1 Tax=Nocardioides sp. W7 TaxID=2931390 RepID=UPI001FD4DD58|nr:GNAT family N-acetyltransferase [Nocardioides sp. W7]